MNDNKTPECADLIAALRTAANGGLILTGKAAGAIVNPQCLEYAANLLERDAEPPNEPLTLEELRGMNDERVFVQFPFLCMYALVAFNREGDEGYDEEDGEDVYLTNNLGGRSTYEEIISMGGRVYRRKPDGGGE